MVSAAQKKARDKWDKENMQTIGCKLTREQAERFKQYAASQGTTANSLLKQYVESVIGPADR